MHRLDWDDLRYILAVADAGSLAGAARDLGVNHTTVLRRINAFEETRGLRLFERLPSGYTLTAGGEELLSAARAMAGVVDDLERKLSGQDLRLEGIIRVTTTDTLLSSLLPPVFASFSEQHPGVRLDISGANAVANFTKRDADVAIRTLGSPPETLVGRKLGGIAWAIYRASSSPAMPLYDPDAPWVAPGAALAGTAAARWLREAHPNARITAEADSFVTLASLARGGIGLAVLPCYLGDEAPGLVRNGGPLKGVVSELWILTHEDLRRTARVSAFMSFMASAIAAKRSALLGQR